MVFGNQFATGAYGPNTFLSQTTRSAFANDVTYIGETGVEPLDSNQLKDTCSDLQSIFGSPVQHNEAVIQRQFPTFNNTNKPMSNIQYRIKLALDKEVPPLVKDCLQELEIDYAKFGSDEITTLTWLPLCNVIPGTHQSNFETARFKTVECIGQYKRFGTALEVDLEQVSLQPEYAADQLKIKAENCMDAMSRQFVTYMIKQIMIHSRSLTELIIDSDHRRGSAYPRGDDASRAYIDQRYSLLGVMNDSPFRGREEQLDQLLLTITTAMGKPIESVYAPRVRTGAMDPYVTRGQSRKLDDAPKLMGSNNTPYFKIVNWSDTPMAKELDPVEDRKVSERLNGTDTRIADCVFYGGPYTGFLYPSPERSEYMPPSPPKKSDDTNVFLFKIDKTTSTTWPEPDKNTTNGVCLRMNMPLSTYRAIIKPSGRTGNAGISNVVHRNSVTSNVIRTDMVMAVSHQQSIKLCTLMNSAGVIKAYDTGKEPNTFAFKKIPTNPTHQDCVKFTEIIETQVDITCPIHIWTELFDETAQNDNSKKSITEPEAARYRAMVSASTVRQYFKLIIGKSNTALVTYETVQSLRNKLIKLTDQMKTDARMTTTVTSDGEFYVSLSEFVRNNNDIDKSSFQAPSKTPVWEFMYFTFMHTYLSRIGNSVQIEDVIINPCVGIPARRFYDDNGKEFDYAGTAPWSQLKY